jgi:redox-sensitive bicupin YhaK (pirin superfamily)
VGEHPHRGFETVTIVYQGEVEHRDSGGNHGKISVGDVQWMTAASGVVHEEMHSRAFTERGGTMEMVQLWVNLPARLKMSPPRYQEVLSKNIPVVALEGGAGTVRVIAGTFASTAGPAQTYTPMNLWDLKLTGGTQTELPAPAGHNAGLFVMKGSLTLASGEKVTDAQIAIFEPGGAGIAFKAEKDTVALLLTGEPIDEPIAGYGPFVMNTRQEIQQAMLDYQSGKMGHLDT